jgi:hypothetical protein
MRSWNEAWPICCSPTRLDCSLASSALYSQFVNEHLVDASCKSAPLHTLWQFSRAICSSASLGAAMVVCSSPMHSTADVTMAESELEARICAGELPWAGDVGKNSWNGVDPRISCDLAAAGAHDIAFTSNIMLTVGYKATHYNTAARILLTLTTAPASSHRGSLQLLMTLPMPRTAVAQRGAAHEKPQLRFCCRSRCSTPSLPATAHSHQRSDACSCCQPWQWRRRLRHGPTLAVLCRHLQEQQTSVRIDLQCFNTTCGHAAVLWARRTSIVESDCRLGLSTAAVDNIHGSTRQWLQS